MADDWRIRVELKSEEHAGSLVDRLAGGLSREARELAQELKRDRLVVSRRDSRLLVYADSREQAEKAREIVEAELREHGLEAEVGPVEHWLDDEDRWDTEPPGPDIEEELLERGIAPWEVRVECDSREQAERDVRRFWRFLLLGATTREEAEELAVRLHGEVEPSSELVWEVMPGNPFAVFGGLAG